MSVLIFLQHIAIASDHKRSVAVALAQPVTYYGKENVFLSKRRLEHS